MLEDGWPDSRGTLPDLVVLPASARPRYTEGGRLAAQFPAEARASGCARGCRPPEPVDVAGLALVERLPVPQGESKRRRELGLGILTSQEVPRAVQLVARHQRRGPEPAKLCPIVSSSCSCRRGARRRDRQACSTRSAAPPVIAIATTAASSAGPVPKGSAAHPPSAAAGKAGDAIAIAFPLTQGESDRDDRARTDNDDAEVGRKLPRSTLAGPRSHRDQDVGGCDVVWTDAEVPDGQIPNALILLKQTERAQTALRQRLTFGSQSIAGRSPARARQRTHREDAELDPGSTQRAAATGAPPPRPTTARARARQPQAGSRAHDRSAHGCGDCPSRRALPERPGHEHREEREQPCSRELLDPTPERVAEQIAGCAADEGRERAHGFQWDERSAARTARNAPSRPRTSMYGWKIQARSWPADPDRHQRACRIAEGERRRPASPRTSTVRGLEEVARVFHDTVNGEVRRGVVELDATGEGRLTREDDRCREDCEDCDCGAERPHRSGRTGGAAIRPHSGPAIASPAARGRRQLGRQSCPSTSRTRRRG